VLFTQTQPFQNHNGGNLVFGPDGFLYLGLGDGGSADDPQRNGQNLTTALGKLLRFDVNVPDGLDPAPGNPFAGAIPGRDDIWAYGLRNPWRFTFDRATGDLYIADVGQNALEEVNFQAAASSGGRNYGWNIWEAHAPHPINAQLSTNTAGVTFPILEYPHGAECSITGGYVYRGAAIPALQGAYLYGDYCSGKIWQARAGAAGLWTSDLLLATTFAITSFGEDEAGEVYVVHQGGFVYRLVAA
jgi:glucose/arabinose dehydrogenase